MNEYTFRIPVEITIKMKAEDKDQAIGKVSRALKDNAQISGKIFITLPIGWNNIDISVPNVEEKMIHRIQVLSEKPF